MGEIGERSNVLDHVFKQYDRLGKGELSPHEVQSLHADIRMGGISYPQVLASMKYTCVTDTCTPDELYDLLQEMDRRYFLLQDFRWEFTMLDREQRDTITEDQARWMVQAVHGKNFSRRKWAEFLRKRAVPSSRVSLAEIEVLLCNVKSSLDNLQDREEEEREIQEKLRKQQQAEEEERLEHERRRKLKEDERRKKEEEKRRLEDEGRRRMMQEEEERRRQQQQKEEEERQREEDRLRELEKQHREEEERRQREDAEKYKDAEEHLKEAERQEREFEEELKRIRQLKKEAEDEKRRRELEEEEERLKRLHRDMKHKRIRYRLKVAIKEKDRFKLEYTVNEFEVEKVEDKDMDLEKAKRLLKELVSKDSLRRAMSRREIVELETAITVIKKNGLEVQLAKELIEANAVLARLRKIQRIRAEILELKQSTVAEIRSYTNPPPMVHTIMTATFLILGHKEKETKDWKTVQALVGKTGKEGLKRRCLECDASKIPMAAAKRAKELLDRHDLDEVRDVSAGAATFHVFSCAMIEECYDIAENGPRPGSTPAPGGAAPTPSKPRIDPSSMTISRTKVMTTSRARSKTPPARKATSAPKK